MKSPSPRVIHSISELHAFLNLKKPTHPLVSVVNLADEQKEEVSSQQPDSILEYEELCQEVESAIQSLPAKCRRIYLMHRFEEKKYAEIAAELQLSARTVEVQIRKASLLVKKALATYWLLLAVWVVTI